MSFDPRSDQVVRPPAPTDEVLQAIARGFHEDAESALLPMRLHEWKVPIPDRKAILSAARQVPTPALAHVVRFHEDPRLWELVLWGGYRVGKSYAAVRWLVEAAKVPVQTLELGRTFRYATSARFFAFADLAEAAGSYRRDDRALVGAAIGSYALVLDDVGAQLRAAAPILDQVISARHLHHRPTLITTNLGRDLFGRPDHFGQRVVLRLDEGGGFRGCGGDDERLALRAALEDA